MDGFKIGTIFILLIFISLNLVGVNLLLDQKHSQMKDLVYQVQKTNDKLERMEKRFELTLDATGYSPEKAQCDDDPYTTALMKRSKPGWHIAVSQDLKWMLGKKVYIEGYGVRYVADLMNKRFKKRIDIMFPTRKGALRFGKKKLEVTVLWNDGKRKNG